jgi:hypothetical protein
MAEEDHSSSNVTDNPSPPSSPRASRNVPQSLRHLLLLCWLLVVMQIWFASDDFIETRQQHHNDHHDGGVFAEKMMDLPRSEEEGVGKIDDISSTVERYHEKQASNMNLVDATALSLAPNDNNMTNNNATILSTNHSSSTTLSKAAHNKNMTNNNVTISHNHSSNSYHTKSYNCSIVWVRIPKTASSTIHKQFMTPLSTWFVNTYIGPQTCVSNPGGCLLHWNVTTLSTPINYNSSNSSNKINGDEYEDPACEECFEYNNATRTINYGPIEKLSTFLQKHHLTTELWVRKQIDSKNAKFLLRTVEESQGVYSPSIYAHVGLQTSLFNYILPSNPLVFSAFRDPTERFFSSFHYGIMYGAAKPGHVHRCPLEGSNSNWQKRIANARMKVTVSNDTSDYEGLLQHYLMKCKDASWNVYTQFLDPVTKDVNVALANLEKYVIVGLKTNITETLQLWANMTRKNCHNHRRFESMQQSMLSIPFRETFVELREKMSIGEKDLIKFVTPDYTNFQNDLTLTIEEFIKEDKRIYNRVKELYKQQLREVMF